MKWLERDALYAMILTFNGKSEIDAHVWRETMLSIHGCL